MTNSSLQPLSHLSPFHSSLFFLWALRLSFYLYWAWVPLVSLRFFAPSSAIGFIKNRILMLGFLFAHGLIIIVFTLLY